ncbi:hypothetical protein A3K64_01175 [Candidatus Micrarchaeota archaeon RBG_16_36_9]|nr:MAG: hypothetical protein A3K64_01175 [Candidatus Micrarchaeota archaeon RBG_16_36_9]
MKGMELKVILTLIICALCLALLIVFVVLPVIKAGESGTYSTDFWYDCSRWSYKGYNGYPDNRDQMNESCTRALGKDCSSWPNCMINDDDWDDCRNACVLSANKNEG